MKDALNDALTYGDAAHGHAGFSSHGVPRMVLVYACALPNLFPWVGGPWSGVDRPSPHK
jgi:hypothetical protein